MVKEGSVIRKEKYETIMFGWITNVRPDRIFC